MITIQSPSGRGGETVATVTGVLDVVHAPALAAAALRALDAGAISLVVDLRLTTTIDPTGAGTLLRIHHRGAVLGVPVHVALPTLVLAEQLRRTGLAGRLHLVPDLDWASRCCLPVDRALDLRAAALAG